MNRQMIKGAEMLDIRVINDFRDLINGNSNYILHKTRNKDGRNKYNIICSAMDWITVAVNNINEFSPDFERSKIDEYCMRVFSYISTIDIILESVVQLSRVITERRESPFKGECKFFSNNTFKDDDTYFKHIRAVFGAHPVNLRPSGNNDDCWYASWPTVTHIGNYDIQVFLYSVNPEKSDEIFGVYFKELNKYLKRRYLYIRFLMKFIEKNFQKYVHTCLADRIQYSGDALTDLRIAHQEIIKRLPNEYVESMISDSILFLQTESTRSENHEVVSEFLREIKKAVSDLTDAVQKLDYEEKETYKIFECPSLKEHHYEFQKYNEVLRGNNDALEKYFFEVISKDLEHYVYIDDLMSYQEINLLMNAGLYKYSKSSKTNTKIKA